jgi:hypothetical protein
LFLNELVFLAPIKTYIWEEYAEKILLVSGVLALNVFCLLYASIRWTRLQDTGEKLRHLEKQLFRLSWKWRERSPVKITERTREERTEELHGRRKGGHSEAAPGRQGADLDFM